MEFTRDACGGCLYIAGGQKNGDGEIYDKWWVYIIKKSLKEVPRRWDQKSLAIRSLVGRRIPVKIIERKGLVIVADQHRSSLCPFTVTVKINTVAKDYGNGLLFTNSNVAAVAINSSILIMKTASKIKTYQRTPLSVPPLSFWACFVSKQHFSGFSCARTRSW